jgi:hypothetical protein
MNLWQRLLDLTKAGPFTGPGMSLLTALGTLAQLPQFEGPGAFFVGSTRVKSAELRTDARGSRV